jgi:DNA-binding transcriptional regulator YiaG
MADANDQSESLQMALEEAGQVVETARKNLAQLEKSLTALGKHEQQLNTRLERARQRRRNSGQRRKTSAETNAELALRSVKQMLRRNRSLLSQQRKSCRDKERALARLHKQADVFRSKVTDTRNPSAKDKTAPAFTGAERLDGRQLAGARAMLGMSIADFTALIGLGAAQVRAAEKTAGELDLGPDTTRDVLERLWDMGIELVQPGIYVGNGGPGIRIRLEHSSVANAAGTSPRKRRTSRQKKKPRKAKAA